MKKGGEILLMANVKFNQGSLDKLDTLSKKAGQIIFTTDKSNNGQIYYDKDEETRIKMSATADKAISDDTGAIIKNTYLSTLTGTDGATFYQIISKTGSGQNKNTLTIPTNKVSSANTSNKIFLLGTTSQTANATTAYSHDTVFVDTSGKLNATVVGSLEGKANTAGTADKALAVEWDDVDNKPTGEIVKSINYANNKITYTYMDGTIKDVGAFAPVDPATGIIPIDNIPKSAIERLTIVTSLEDIQSNPSKYPNVGNGDTILDSSTGIMYYIVDESKLTTDEGYQEYYAGTAAAVEWANVKNKPGNLVTNFKVTSDASSFTITPQNFNGGNLTSINIPAASATLAGIITTGTQDLKGAKNLRGNFMVGNGDSTDAYQIDTRIKNTDNTYNTMAIKTSTNKTGIIDFSNFNTSGTSQWSTKLLFGQTSIYPEVNNIKTLGTSANKWKEVYATSFKGNADTASKAETDSLGNKIDTTYLKSVTGAVNNGYIITTTKGDGTTSTFTIPLANASILGLLSTGTQDIVGVKTFNSIAKFKYDIQLVNPNDGISLTDNAGYLYYGLYDNGNLWVGSSGSSAKAHHGAVYISSGFNSDEETGANASIYISVPSKSGTIYSHTAYPVIHSGNWKDYVQDWRTVSWTNGTTAGPIAVFTDRSGGGKYNAPAIPVATANTSGVITTGAQTIAGAKTFNGGVIGNLTGNASTATKLAAAKTINGTAFDGSTNITTANWGTARNISISSSDGTGTGVATSVNGSGNVVLKLPASIKASLTGNASTATILQTARTINGTSFNGSANITTANWGAARTIKIGNTAKSVNGSQDLTWTLSEIGIPSGGAYLPLTGGTLTGDLDVHSRFIRMKANNPYIILTNTDSGDGISMHYFGATSGNNTFGLHDEKNQVHLLLVGQNGYSKFEGPGDRTQLTIGNGEKENYTSYLRIENKSSKLSLYSAGNDAFSAIQKANSAGTATNYIYMYDEATQFTKQIQANVGMWSNGYLYFAPKTGNGMEWITNNDTRFHVRPYSPSNIWQVTVQGPDTNNTEIGAFNILSNGNAEFVKQVSFYAKNTFNEENVFRKRVYVDKGDTVQAFLTTGNNPKFASLYLAVNGTWTNALELHETYTTLTKPLTVGSGGTGAANATGARSNLSVPEIRGGTVICYNQCGLGTNNTAGQFWKLWNLQAGDVYPAWLMPSQNGTQGLGHSSYRIKEAWINDFKCGTWNGNVISVAKGGTGASSKGVTLLNNIGIYYSSSAPANPVNGTIWLKPA